MDLLAALLFITLMSGAYFGSSDDVYYASAVRHVQNPELYSRDFAFSGDQGEFSYHAFGVHVLSLLARWMDVEWAMILSVVLCRLCLLVALSQLASRLSGRPIPHLAVALLLVDRTDLVGSYFLTTSGYSVHYAALALGLVGLAAFVNRRMFLGVGASLLAILFHPIIGSGCLAFFGCMKFWGVDRRHKTVTAIAVMLGIIATIGSVVWYYARPGVWLQLTEITRIRVFLRGPWHLSPAYWQPAVFLNLALIASLLVVLWIRKKDELSRNLVFAGAVGMAAVTVGIINNTWLLDPFLILAGPFEIGPIVLSIVYVLALVVLAERIERGYWLSTAVVFLAPSVQTWAVVFLLVLLVDWFMASQDARLGKLPVWKKDLLMASVGVAGCIAQYLLLHTNWLESASWSILRLKFYVLTLTAMGMLALWRLHKVTLPGLAGVMAAGCLLVWYHAGRLESCKVRFSPEKRWVEVCDVVANRTSVDAAVVVPPEAPDFELLSLRSAFVSFKLMPSELSQTSEWYRRVQRLRLFPTELVVRDVRAPVDANYRIYDNLGTADFMAIRADYPFVSHCVVRRNVELALPLIFENDSYRLYDLGTASLVELRSIAEVSFPIVLPSMPLACEVLVGGHGTNCGWVTVGVRGAISMQGVEDQSGVMRITAGDVGSERGESCHHCLLLQPVAAGEQGLTIVPGAQLAEFECDMRSAIPEEVGRLLVRLDRNTESGWVCTTLDQGVKVGEQWTSRRVSVDVGKGVNGIRPILEWHPGAPGARLELRAPRLRWISVVKNVHTMAPMIRGEDSSVVH